VTLDTLRAMRSLLLAIACAALLAACAEPAPKPKAPPPDPTPKNGVVGLVSEVKTRAITQDNWKGALGGLFSMDPEKGVASTAYEVTVFYDDGSTGVVTLERRPDLVPGQKVRVTGNKIERR
jgi:hypothetical protein